MVALETDKIISTQNEEQEETSKKNEEEPPKKNWAPNGFGVKNG